MNNRKKTLGIYLHIPFCVKKCDYCDFNSFAAEEETKKSYVRALLEEIKSHASKREEYRAETCFFGGGTPSCLEAEEIALILKTVKETFCCAASMEITLEANPGTLTKEKLRIYKEAGINRLSMGLQSADNEELKLLGRIHTYEEFIENYREARQEGFSNISVDLMSALPDQTAERFFMTLEKVSALQPEHISVYSLIIEEGTPFYERYGSNPEKLPSEETDRSIYRQTKRVLESKGYHRYEISNYARDGFESRHNSFYWNRTDYLGIGLGASSLLNNERYYNETQLTEYMKQAWNCQLLKREAELLNREKQMEEFMFLGLRMTKGVSEAKFNNEFGISMEELYQPVIERFLKGGFLTRKDGRIALTEKGIDVSNRVLSEFLIS